MTAPAQDEEFILSHSDNVEAQGFVQHLKLPHYIDFQAELNLIRQLRHDYDKARAKQNDVEEGPRSRLTTPTVAIWTATGNVPKKFETSCDELLERLRASQNQITKHD